MRVIKIRMSSQEVLAPTFEGLTFEEVLLMRHLPTNLFQGYIVNSARNELKPVPLDTCIQSIPEDEDIILQCIRNTDLRQVLPQYTVREKVDEPITITRNLDFSNGECTETIFEIDSLKARNLVTSKIEEFMIYYSNAQRVIVGMSGGGDSNALIKGLKNFSDKYGIDKKYICFTLVFEPFWPKSAAERAVKLCRESNVENQVLCENEMEELLGMRGNLHDFFAEFKESFGITTHNFFATYLISKVARKLCCTHKTDEYCLGFNREDILSEILFLLINGRRPLAYPVRSFGNVKLLMPLWTLPKKILDACYPTHSKANYREREQGDDTTTLQRSIIFYLGHAVDDVYDNFGFSLMLGIKNLFSENWAVSCLIEEADLYVMPDADPRKVEVAQELLAKYFK